MIKKPLNLIKKPKKLPLDKQYKVDILLACKTVYINIDTPELKVLIPLKEKSINKQNLQKDGFILVKNDVEMSFFINQNLLIKANTVLAKLNHQTKKGA